VSAEPEYRPRLNHVAITMDRDLLDDNGRKEILDFYGDVFGWTEGDNTGERGNPLIMYTGEFGQFVFLVPGDASAPTTVDHFGLEVSTCEEIEDIVAKAKKRQETDDRVSVTDIHSRITNGPVHEYTLTSAYIGFALPLTIELQNITRRES
jgi:catechol 2,3-dioxygenase-like lactoylglutathione lyase family enzyme